MPGDQTHDGEHAVNDGTAPSISKVPQGVAEKTARLQINVSSVSVTCQGGGEKKENHRSVETPDTETAERSNHDVTPQPLSKKLQKKLEKRRRWLEQKPLRKAREKEKRKLKIEQARESGRDLGPSRKLLKSLKMSDSSCKLKICFDLSLADVMSAPEFSKTFKQLHRCYSINRRAPAPLQLYVTGYSDAVKQLMSIRSGCFNWDVNFDSSPYHEVFERDKIVYLTSDSPNEMEELDYDKTYIIGALVDHNRLKNICYEKAEKEGVSHACLPLDAYFKFKTRKVLTIDQVYLIFLRLTEGNSWIDAIMGTVPKRKGVELKKDVGELNQNSSAENAESDSEDLCCENIVEKDAVLKNVPSEEKSVACD